MDIQFGASLKNNFRGPWSSAANRLGQMALLGAMLALTSCANHPSGASTDNPASVSGHLAGNGRTYDACSGNFERQPPFGPRGNRDISE